MSFSGNSGCTYEVTRTYLHELERISGRRFFVQDNGSDIQQFAREGCATLGSTLNFRKEIRKMASSIIVSNPAILSGEPVFRGTRVPFKSLTDYLEHGRTLSEFLEDFPSVTSAEAIAAIEEARTSLTATLK